MTPKILENLKNLQKSIADSQRKDCAEYYSDCVCDPHISGCSSNCLSYNKVSSEKASDLRRCECGSKKDPEIAHVTYSHWAVLCHECGALGKAGKEKSASVKYWNEGKLVRDVGYFTSGKFEEEAYSSARRLAGL